MLKKRPILLGILITILTVGCSAIVFSNEAVSRFKLYQVSSRVGTSMTWNAVRYHVYCRVLANGRGRSEAESDLKNVGAFHSDGDPSDNAYVFEDAFLASELSRINVRFVSNRIIGKYIVGDKGFGDTYRKNIDCAELNQQMTQ